MPINSALLASSTFQSVGNNAVVLIPSQRFFRCYVEGVADGLLMAEQADVVARVRAGQEASFKFLVGQVMKATRGRANPESVNRLLREKIDAGASESQR